MKQIHRIALVQFLLMLPFAAGIRAQEPFWRQLDRPFGGNVFFFITAPNGTLYTGTEWSGMYRSSDEGSTWTQFGPPGAGGAYPSVVTPEGIILVSTDDRGGIFRSTDDGLTWAQSAQGALSVRPSLMARTPTGTIVLASDSGVYRSTNNGALWSHAGLADIELRFPEVAPNGTVYVASEDSGLFRSTDDGRTWLGVGTMQDRAIDAFLFSDGPEMIVGTDDGIFRSLDSGDTFTPFALPGMGIGPLALGRLPSGDLVAATQESGLYRISPDGAIATPIPAAPRENLYGLAVTRSGNIVLGYEGRGILFSSDEGATFRQVGVLHGLRVASLTEGPDGDIYAGGERSGLYRSSDRGTTWEYLDLPAEARYLGFTSAASILAAGSQGDAFRSSDNGATWKRIDVDVQTDFSGLEVAGPGIAVISSNNGIVRTTDDGASWNEVVGNENVYALSKSPNGELWGVGFSKIFHSADAGATWAASELSGEEVESRSFYTIASPEDGVLLLGTNIGDTVVLFRSTDGGTTWSRVAPLGCNDYGIALDQGINGDLFASTGCGIYRSADAGVTWSLYAPLPADERGGEFLADSRGELWFGGSNGIYTAEQPSAVPVEGATAAEGLSLSLFPNPTRGETSVAFGLTAGAHVTLSLRTLLGETVAVLHDGPMDAGDHTIRIDHALPSGTYLLDLRAGDRTASTMMHVTR